jgi:enoyl-CoA hydratase/carnithine racemase
MDAEEALRHGVISRVVPRDELDATAFEIARHVATLPPLAVRAWRQCLQDIATPPVSAALHAELLAQMLVYKSDDFAEFKKARAEERPPDYRTT